MPGTFTIDTPRTFTTMILMGSMAKLKFGSTEQDVSANGERKWQAEVAVTFHPQPGMKPISEVLSVTVTGPPTDPAAGIPPGSQVELADFRVGFSAPEHGEGQRIRGGRPWYQASAIRSLNGRPGPGKGEG